MGIVNKNRESRDLPGFRPKPSLSRRAAPKRDVDSLVQELAKRRVELESKNNEVRQAQAALRQAQEKWERTFDTVPDPIAIVDREHRLVRANRAMASRLGITPEQSVGMRCYEIVHGTDSPPAFCPHVRTCADGCEHTAEIHEDRLGGDFVITTTPFTDEQGQHIGSVHLARDVTQHNRTEQALMWTGRRNELLSRTAARLLQSEDPQGIVDDVCRQVMELLDCDAFFNFMVEQSGGRLRLNACAGIPEAEARNIPRLEYGMPVCGGVTPDRKPITFEDVQHTSDTRTDLIKSYGIQAYCCHPLLVKDRLIGTLSFGTRSRPRFQPAHVEVMKAVADLVAIAMNRIETEAALRESETRLKVAQAIDAERQRLYDVLETLPVYVVLLSPDYRVPFANRFFEDRFGKSNGRRCYEYLFDRTEPCEICETFTVVKTNEPHHWQWTGPDGRDYDIYDFPFTDADGSRLIMEMGIDVTERNQAERALRDRSEQLRALAAQLSQAEQRERKRLAKILHDHIQQLIVAARLQVDFLKRDSTPNRVKAAAHGVDGMLREALEASRSLTVDLSPPALHDRGLLGGLNWLAARMREQQQLTVNLRASTKAEPPTEEMRFLLFECARELLLNAAKHAGVGEAEVTLVRLETPEIKLVVRDKGKGFDTDVLKNRLATEMSFGLFSIQERLAYVGGRMDIESAPDRGTQVTLTVPVLEHLYQPEPVERITSDADDAMITMRRTPDICRVLIVDDHKLMREGLLGLFAFESDIEVIGEAATAAEAIELAASRAPDVVIMDVNLGGMNGIEATRRILANDPEIKVIGLSMHIDEHIASAMRDAGAAAYLNKGEPVEDLIAAIRACYKQ